MVLLTMTPAIVDAIGKLHNKSPLDESKPSTEPSLLEPAAGKPISHSQVLHLSKQLKADGYSDGRLEVLLRGSKVYVPPQAPKPEPTSEYKSLMARLRREEESRVYERMLNPTAPTEIYQTGTSAAHAISSTAAYASTFEDDEITYNDINRQMAMIANVLISIIACSAAIWIAAKWWSTPARLALSMTGSLVVAAAEVAVYSGYLRRLTLAKGEEGKIKEVREIVSTWVSGSPLDEDQLSSPETKASRKLDEDSSRQTGSQPSESLPRKRTLAKT